ncbi:hypothetical protein AURDEDRAFT_186829 [Auricularia subglabra TFB-10046 SS5]|uniref:Ricin B lectin domain-containing protein n=1 Tax=Auricularia subglabra (strain TFB-10046 / SS5) TaxID=717982 RepID=J0DCV6_AURST|nr:hypothetical protein AURDEDRAFT_186829 [Auricularia subglabra TFB-10046 SS5]
MLASVLSTILLSASLSTAAPLLSRQTRLDPEAVAEAQQRDNTATRAFSAVPIKTSDGQCLTVDPLGGDFRQNLVPVAAAACDGSANQQFDVITSGKHNDQPGQALIVSTPLSNCLNFDGRRQPGNQVLMFSCGGRADGGGQVTDSQLFAFADPTATTIALSPLNSRRDGTVCLKIVNGKLDQAPCDPSQPAADQLFTLGDAAPTQPTPPPADDSSNDAPPEDDPTEDQPSDEPPAAPPVGTTVLSPGTTNINEEAAAEAQRRDDTATRAFSNVPIKTSDGLCLFVDPRSGDFRQNLTPIQAVTCDANNEFQRFDVITSGKHNDQPGFALVVSSAINSCLNVDGRRREGNTVLMFSCGGRADGDGGVTNSQLFSFDGQSTLALAPQNGKGFVCLKVVNGLLDQSDCDASQPAADQLFTIGDGGNAAPPAPPAATPEPTPEQPAAPSPSPVTETPSAPTQPSKGTTKLDPEAVAEAQQRDNGATRAFSAVPIKTSSGNCLTVDPLAGDFRQNLIPVNIAPCDGSANQQWDVITAGAHNDRPGNALFVSSLTQGCMNVDERRRPGNQVLLFSCGGRADGGGQVTDSQLFAFDGSETTLPLVPANGRGSKCLFDNGSGLDLQDCDSASASGAQLFSIA